MRPAVLVLLPLLACGGGKGPVQALEGTLQWTVDFDAVAEGRGFADCSYKRRYSGHTDDSMPWLCPDCDAVFRVDADLTGRSCYDTITDEPPPETEWLGWSGTGFRRASFPNFVLSEMGEVTADGDKQAVTADTEPREIEGGGAFTLRIEGTLRTGRTTGDPMWGLAPPNQYDCGWQRADPPAYTGDWTLRPGKPIPDGWFPDACGQGVRLYDQLDRYLVIAVSAVDCPPCLEMAEGEEAFLSQARADGLDVGAVTLLAPSLSGILDPTSPEQLEDWTDAFGLTEPVLADRGWGYWLGTGALGDAMAYPAVLVVAPDGTLLSLDTGFASWDRLRQVIEADAAGIGR